MLFTPIGTLVILAGSAFGVLFSSGALHAEELAIAPFLTDDVVAVGQVNLQRLDLAAIADELIRLKAIPYREVEKAKQAVIGIQKVYAELPGRGARRLYVLPRPGDVIDGGTTWVIETGGDEEARSVGLWLKAQLEGISPQGGLKHLLPQSLETEGRLVIGSSSAERMQAILAKRTASPRPEAVAALSSLDDADAGIVVFGSADSRRVVRELFPQLPAPFTEIDGKLLADGVAWAAVHVKLPPAPVVTLALAANGDESAGVLATAFDKAREVLRVVLAAEAVSGVPNHQKRAAALLPMVPQLKLDRDATRLSLAFGDDEEELTFLRYALPAVTQDMRDDAYRSSRMNNFKQLALGILNYESANGTAPAAASYDKNGRPLLSWRVLILPYMERGELYKQFKLDEPWDSEHNRKLIDKMPEVFSDPDPSVRSAIGDAGRTTYVVPTGAGLIFGGKVGLKYRDIDDGTSNTIMIVEAPPERAVVWTKPEDWEVDLDNPLQGVQRKDRKWFTTAFADGSARVLGTDIKPSSLRALLTASGEDVVDHDDP